MFHKRNWIIYLMLALVVVACTPVGAERAAEPEDDSAEQIGTESISAARQALAEYLDVVPDTLNLEKIEPANWGDACLGLGGPAESCAAVVTSGYAITFTVAGESYEVRTDLAGNLARVEAASGATPTGAAPRPVVEAARAALAHKLGVESGAIGVVDYDQQEWSDSCLGLGGPAESCAAVVTPGWKVILEVTGQLYEVRSDFSGEQVRIADGSGGEPAGEAPGPALQGAVVFFQRSGGFDGQLLTVRIYPEGIMERALGEPTLDMPVATATIDPIAVETLLSNLEEVDYFRLERAYLAQDTCCDRFLYLISIAGKDGVHTVEALEAAADAPDALWQSIALIEALIHDAYSG